jgi:putative membrane protein
MSGFHGFLSKQQKLLEKGTYKYSGKQYRYLNEVPTILMILIIIMVVVRPF